MNTVVKCFVILSSFLYIAIPSAGQAGNLPSARQPVVCVIGTFTVPANETPAHWNADDRLVVTLNNIPDNEFALLNRCYAQRRGVGRALLLPLPYIVSRGATKRRVQVVMCVKNGAYVYESVIAPRSNFTVNMTARNLQSRGSSLARQYCN